MGIELLGWAGSILFATCALPQTIKTVKEGHAEGLSWLFLIMWFFGEVLTLAYVLNLADIPLIFNYLSNLVLLVPIIYYKSRPRSKG